MGSTSRVKDHPDGRAIFYEETTYSKRKIADFIVVLEGFKASLKITEVFSACADDLNSRLLKAVALQPSKGGEGSCSLGLGSGNQAAAYGGVEFSPVQDKQQIQC